jgi:hypothetical protein
VCARRTGTVSRELRPLPYELGKDKLEPTKRAWLLALLFSITGRNDPRSSEILGSYQDRPTGWHLSGGRDGQTDSSSSGWREGSSHEGRIDSAQQRTFATTWERFREFMLVREIEK